MQLHELQAIAQPVKIEGDVHNLASNAFTRANSALPDELADDTVEQFKAFLQAEIAEMLRRADYHDNMAPYYHDNMAPYYHENVAESCRFEALAFEQMLEQLPT